MRIGRIWELDGWAAWGLALAALFVVAVSDSSFAADKPVFKGVALVVGQSRYEQLAVLDNPSRDADAIGKLLERLGFAVTQVSDQNSRKLRRDLEGFVEDAEGADVAIIYYSGHGIEAGGENFLVPVDADVRSLDDAGEKLVPLSAILAELKKTVPVTIVLLDACRNDPFPPGSILKLSSGDEGKPIGSGGLGETRGVVALKDGSSNGAIDDSLGQVIGFAAEPGKVALDGNSGGNSPYAAAILRHLGAMQGQEFGIVLRMIGEEVYLKTSGQQRPWVNESLRRLLFFGGSVDEPTGEEGEILTERRQLLVKIAELPDFERSQIETIARDGGVPMDALYGMLRVLGADKPDPTELDLILRRQTERLKSIVAQREALASADPEIERLSTLADKALAEGAIDANLKFREAAKARFAAVAEKLDADEANLKARRLEGGEIFAKVADAYALKSDYQAAADNYAKAFAQVARWDQKQAWEYKLDEASALQVYGDEKGDNDALKRSIKTFNDALLLAPRTDRPDGWAETKRDLGVALRILGRRQADTELLTEAVAAFRASLEIYTRQHAPLEWAAARSDLAATLSNLADREDGTAGLYQAAAAFRQALNVLTRDRQPLDWAMTQNNLGTTLVRIGEREHGTMRLDEAVVAFRAALSVYTLERMPLTWALVQNNLGCALETLGERGTGITRLEEAIAAHRAVLEVATRESIPLIWANTQNNLGVALLKLAEREPGTARLKEALLAFRAALSENTRERAPLVWASVQSNVGSALKAIGDRDGSAARVEEAITAYRVALEESTRDRVPAVWAATQYSLGNALRELATHEPGTARLEEAIKAYGLALQERTRVRAPLDWAATQQGLGIALLYLGARETATVHLEEAVASLRSALEELALEREPLDWAKGQRNLGVALQAIGDRETGLSRLQEAVAAYRAALRGYGKLGMSIEYAETQQLIGKTFMTVSKREPGTVHLAEAAAAFRSALDGHRREQVPQSWAESAYSLGDAKSLLGDRLDGQAAIVNWNLAIEAWRQAQLVMTRENDPEKWAILQNNVGYYSVMISERSNDPRLRTEAIAMLRQALSVQRSSKSPLARYTDDSLCRALLDEGLAAKDRTTLHEAEQHCNDALEGEAAASDDGAASETAVYLDKIKKALRSLP